MSRGDYTPFSNMNDSSNEVTSLDASFSDTVDLPTFQMIRSVYVGVAGDIKITDWFGNTTTVKAAPVGVLHIRPRRIWATGTTATNVLALR